MEIRFIEKVTVFIIAISNESPDSAIELNGSLHCFFSFDVTENHEDKDRLLNSFLNKAH